MEILRSFSFSNDRINAFQIVSMFTISKLHRNKVNNGMHNYLFSNCFQKVDLLPLLLLLFVVLFFVRFITLGVNHDCSVTAHNLNKLGHIYNMLSSN